MAPEQRSEHLFDPEADAARASGREHIAHVSTHLAAGRADISAAAPQGRLTRERCVPVTVVVSIVAATMGLAPRRAPAATAVFVGELIAHAIRHDLR
jgi:hypothetical protein